MEKIIARKNENFTIVDNEILRDKAISLKAKAMHITVMSLPPDWDFSVAGIAVLVKEGRDAVLAAIRELREAGYCEYRKERNTKGHFSHNYIFYQSKALREGSTPEQENPDMENPELEKPTQTNNINNKVLNNKIQTNSARARSPINAIPESSKTDLPSEKEVFDLLVEKLFPEKQAGKLAASFCEEMQARKKEKPSFKISSLQGYLSSYLAGKGIQPKKEPVYRNDELEQRRRKVEEENARVEQDFGSRENWLKAQKEAIRLKKEGTRTA